MKTEADVPMILATLFLAFAPQQNVRSAAAQPAWFRANERPPSYWVPQASLRPFEELAVTYQRREGCGA